MIDGKRICPMMSRPIIRDGYHVGLAEIFCLEEWCMAWREPCSKNMVCQDCLYYEEHDPTNCIGLTGYCDLIRKEPEVMHV